MIVFAFIITGFLSCATVLPGSHPVLPRLGVRRTIPLPLRRMAPCICSGGRVGGRSERRKQAESEKRDTGAPLAWQWFGPVQRAMAVLVPAIATACVPYGPWHELGHLQPPSICQIPALSVHISSEAELEALKRLSSSVNYPGSRNDIAEATRDYVEQPILLTHELATIRVKVQIDHNAEMGQWTYPGWRADALKALDARPDRTSTSRDQAPQVVAMASTMDRQQMLHEKLPPSAASSVWTSARSNVGYAVLPKSDIDLNFIWLLLTSYFFIILVFVADGGYIADGALFELKSFTEGEINHSRWVKSSWVKSITLGEFQLTLPLAAWIALPEAVYLACTSSSSLGFIPLVIVCTGCCLRAVLDDDVVCP